MHGNPMGVNSALMGIRMQKNGLVEPELFDEMGFTALVEDLGLVGAFGDQPGATAQRIGGTGADQYETGEQHHEPEHRSPPYSISVTFPTHWCPRAALAWPRRGWGSRRRP